MIEWPETLPQHVTRAWSEEDATVYSSFQSDSGPAIERPKGTIKITDVAFSFIMSGAQVGIFEDFVADDLARGVLAFQIDHPRLQAPALVRMTGQPRYNIRPFAAVEWLVTFRAKVIG